MKIDVKTLHDKDGVPVLLIIKDKNDLLICEADNMDSHIKLRAGNAPSLVAILQALG